MAQGRNLSREDVSNLDERNEQVGGEESTPSSSSAKKARQNRVRLPARFAPHFFELTKTLDFKRDVMTVEWLMKQSELDQDPDKFSSSNEELVNTPPQDMKTPPGKRRQQGRSEVRKDRHGLTEDGRDRRVRVPHNRVSQLIHLTQKLALKSDGDTIEWLFQKYWLCRRRPQQAIQSTTALNSTPTSTGTNFSGAYLSPDNERVIFPRGFSIPSHHQQQNLTGYYEQEVFVEPIFNGNQNSVECEIVPSSGPCDLYLTASSTEYSTNQLQYSPYPPQQTVIHPNSIHSNSMNFQSWNPNAGGMTENDGLIMKGSRFEPRGELGSLENNPHLYGSTSAIAGERLVGPAVNFSYAEQEWNPNSISSAFIPQSHCPLNQFSLPYEGIISSTGEAVKYSTINTNGNSRGIGLSLPYVQQLFYQGSGVNGFGEEPIIPWNHGYTGEIQQPAHGINNSNNDAISYNSSYLQQQL